MYTCRWALEPVEQVSRDGPFWTIWIHGSTVQIRERGKSLKIQNPISPPKNNTTDVVGTKKKVILHRFQVTNSTIGGSWR